MVKTVKVVMTNIRIHIALIVMVWFVMVWVIQWESQAKVWLSFNTIIHPKIENLYSCNFVMILNTKSSIYKHKNLSPKADNVISLQLMELRHGHWTSYWLCGLCGSIYLKVIHSDAFLNVRLPVVNQNAPIIHSGVLAVCGAASRVCSRWHYRYNLVYLLSEPLWIVYLEYIYPSR